MACRSPACATFGMHAGSPFSHFHCCPRRLRVFQASQVRSGAYESKRGPEKALHSDIGAMETRRLTGTPAQQNAARPLLAAPSVSRGAARHAKRSINNSVSEQFASLASSCLHVLCG
jgi:hypothetical protein